MEQGKDISVIIPFYNSEKYLKKSIDSVVEQIDVNFELILIDDGSTDEGPRICRDYEVRDNRVKCFHKENGGAASARNMGISNAAGRYVLFLDSDDYLLKPDALHTLFDKAETDDLDMLFFGGEASSDINHTKVKRPHYLNTENLNVVESGLINMQKAVGCGEYNTHVCMYLLKTKFLKKTGIWFDENMEALEDEEFTFLLRLHADRVENISDVLYHRRYRPNSIMTSMDSGRHIDCLIHLINKLVDHASELNYPEQKQQLFLKASGHLKQLINAYGEADAKVKIQTKNKLKTDLKALEIYLGQLSTINKIIIKNTWAIDIVSGMYRLLSHNTRPIREKNRK